ncbi:hypothetical protein WAE61_21975 [Comamonadaceae bacterium PP-2]
MSVDISGKVIVSFETEDEDEDEIEISAEEFEVEYLSSGERQQGPENCYQIYYESDSFSLRKEIYEYPAGVLNSGSEWTTENCTVTVDDLDIEIGLSDEQEPEDEEN